MAADQDLLDQIAGTVADLYREVESSLVKVIADELKKGLDAPTAEVKLDAIRRLQAAAVAVQARLAKTKSVAVREAIRTAYRSGHTNALTSIPTDALVKIHAKTAMQQVPNAAIMENLAQALHRDLGRVDGNLLRDTLDAYRAVQAATAARIVTGTATRRQASQAAWQRLMDRGITSFTDRAGRQWRLSSYAEMIGRTNAQRAMVQGQTDRLASVGIDLVYISDNVQECKRCRPFESKVLRRNAGPVGKLRFEHSTRDGEMVTVDVLDTLDGARGKGLFHPNCRHSASAFLPGVTKLKDNTEDPEGDVARQKQRALERKIRREKEQALGALDEPSKKAAGARVRAAQAALRDHLAANPKLKRLPYREQIGAGNIPGPDGPKGGAVSDLVPPDPTTPSPAAKKTAPAKPKAAPTAAAKKKADQEAKAKAAEQAAQKAEADRLAQEAAQKAKKAAAAKTRALAAAKAKKAAAAKPPSTGGMRKALRHRSNQDGLDWAKDHHPPPDNLTEAEQDALRAYTGSDYEMVNKGLRGNLPTTPGDLANYERIVKGCDTAFAKSKLPEDVILHRGVGENFAKFLGASARRPDSMHALVGKDFPEDGYMSTSAGRNAAFQGEIYLMIKAPRGTQALNLMRLSQYGEEEREILLDRGMRYVVHAAYHKDDRWFMELEIVPQNWTKPADWKPDPYGDANEGYLNGWAKEDHE
ncbi:phage minor capsid protein [Streptosporangium sp. NPDC087985]|uniref:phage minor capsid protein n=1 Tax=Streptosporangium sp. NPDC087985 TaxID=3366196 RepID=UPI00382F19AE